MNNPSKIVKSIIKNRLCSPPKCYIESIDQIYIYEKDYQITLKTSGDSEKSHLDSYSADEKPFGISFGQWTVKWWKWLLSCPNPINPAADKDGANSGLNQQGPVWFLAGTFGENVIPVRNCIIPHDRCILFPVINYEVNFLENPEINTDDELVINVVEDQNDIINLTAQVDDQLVAVHRVKSNPKVFFVDLPSENCLELPSRRIKIASDGYWVFLKPLTYGRHNIFFHGSCSGGTRTCTVYYNLTIM